jgi:hypothetical protein
VHPAFHHHLEMFLGPLEPERWIHILLVLNTVWDRLPGGLTEIKGRLVLGRRRLMVMNCTFYYVSGQTRPHKFVWLNSFQVFNLGIRH